MIRGVDVNASKDHQAGRATVGPFLAIAAIVYFGLNLVHGDHGLLAWARLARQVDAAEATRAAVAVERTSLEHRTSLLKTTISTPICWTSAPGRRSTSSALTKS